MTSTMKGARSKTSLQLILILVRPSFAVSAMDAPYTTVVTLAQAARDAHMGQGSHVEIKMQPHRFVSLSVLAARLIA